MRARSGLVIGAATVGLATAAGLGAANLASGPPPASAAGPPAQTATGEITRTTLVRNVAVDGTLGYGLTRPVDSRAAGTLTWLPAAGDTVERGHALLRADDLPVVLLYGELPMYRPLAPNADGGDVEQFEANLRALGYSGFTVDRRYTTATAEAVRRWQRDLGRPQTGTVEVSEVIYLPGPIRVAGRAARVGTGATAQVLNVTATARVAAAQVPAQDAAWAVRGGKVDVVLPSGAAVPGVIEDVGAQTTTQSDSSDTSTSTGGGAQQTTVPITVTIPDQAAVQALDQAPVKVRHVMDQRVDVLTVPVTALLAPIEGGYAVEIVDGAGIRAVPVRTGLFADGRVEVSGPGLAAGLQVRVPA